MSDLQIPDIIGTVRGYRTWRLIDGKLHGVYQTEWIWVPGDNTAECALGWRSHARSDMPGETCACGFYSLYQPPRPNILEIGGVIECWGTICLHEDGMRAQYAKIVALHTPIRRERRKLTKRYTDATVYKTRKAMARDYPAADEICGIAVPPPPPIYEHIPRWLNLMPLVLIVLTFGGILQSDVEQPNWPTHFLLGFWIAVMWVMVRTTRRRL